MYNRKNVKSVASVILIAVLLMVALLPVPSMGAVKKSDQASSKDSYFVKQYKDPVVQEQSPGFLSNVLSFFLNIFYYIFILAMALALGYFGVIFGGKLLMYKGMAPQAGSAIKVIETTFLGPNKSLHLIEVAGSLLLVASTQSAINLITEIPDTELLENMKNKQMPAIPQIQFSDLISKISSKISKITKKDDYREGMAYGLKDGIANTIKTLHSNLDKYDQKSDSFIDELKNKKVELEPENES